VEVDSSKDEMKLRSKIDELQLRIQVLLEENMRLKSTNEIFNSTTLPNLREQLSRKEVKGVEHLTDMLTIMQKNFITKAEIAEQFQQLEKLICQPAVGYSNEQMIEVLKSKDIAIQKLQTQLNKY
jgi:hypothetical protein